MFEEESAKKPVHEVILGADLSTLSVGEIDERVTLLEKEIQRLKEERANKSKHMSEAEAFFKKTSN